VDSQAAYSQICWEQWRQGDGLCLQEGFDISSHQLMWIIDCIPKNRLGSLDVHAYTSFYELCNLFRQLISAHRESLVAIKGAFIMEECTYTNLESFELKGINNGRNAHGYDWISPRTMPKLNTLVAYYASDVPNAVRSCITHLTIEMGLSLDDVLALRDSKQLEHLKMTAGNHSALKPFLDAYCQKHWPKIRTLIVVDYSDHTQVHQ